MAEEVVVKKTVAKAKTIQVKVEEGPTASIGQN